MSSFELAAVPGEIPPGGRKSIFVDDLPALLVRIEDRYYAVEDVCTHDGQPLTDGPLVDCQIVCPRHGARFDLATGKPTKMPATSPIRTFAVEVRSDGIYVSPDAAPAEPPLAATAAPVPEATTATASPAVATADPEAAAAGVVGDITDEAVIEALREVIDPELMINIIDLGLVYSVQQTEGKVAVEMTLTSPACPAGPQIVHQSRTAVERIPGVREVEIKLTMSPPWSPDRMTDAARDHLGIF